MDVKETSEKSTYAQIGISNKSLPLCGTNMMTNWEELITTNGDLGLGPSCIIRLGVLTSTGHHYLQVTIVGENDPMFHLLEEGVLKEKFELQVPVLRIRFDSIERCAAFAAAYAEAWERELEVKAQEKQRIEEALAGQLEGEARLLSLEAEEVAIDAALAWFAAQNPTKRLFDLCFKSAAGARRGSARALVKLLRWRHGDDGWHYYSSGKKGSALWNIWYLNSRCGYDWRSSEADQRKSWVGSAATKGVEELKQALGGLDAKAIDFHCCAPPDPPELPRWPPDRAKFGVLEIACGAGRSDCFRFLVGFCGLEPGPESMRQSLASENLEMVRDVWNRLSEAERAEGLVSFAEVAADYHNYVALGWLLGFATAAQFEEIATSVLKSQLAGPLVTLLKCGFSVTRCSVVQAQMLVGADSLWRNDRSLYHLDDRSWPAVLSAAPAPARPDAWTSAYMAVGQRVGNAFGRRDDDEQLYQVLRRCAPVPKALLEFADRVAAAPKWDKRKVKSAMVEHVLTLGGSAPCWLRLLEEAGASAADSVPRCSR
jgi:hypothetical protein